MTVTTMTSTTRIHILSPFLVPGTSRQSLSLSRSTGCPARGDSRVYLAAHTPFIAAHRARLQRRGVTGTAVPSRARRAAYIHQHHRGAQESAAVVTGSDEGVLGVTGDALSHRPSGW